MLSFSIMNYLLNYKLLFTLINYFIFIIFNLCFTQFIIIIRYVSETRKSIIVPDDVNGVSVNFTLLRDDPGAWSVEYDFSQASNIQPMENYLTDEEINKELISLDRNAPDLVQFFDSSLAFLKMSEHVSAV